MGVLVVLRRVARIIRLTAIPGTHPAVEEEEPGHRNSTARDPVVRVPRGKS